MPKTPRLTLLRGAALALLLGAGLAGAGGQARAAEAGPAPVTAPVQPAEPYRSVKLADDLWMVSGGTGANVTVMSTDDGLVLVDGKYEDQYAALTKYIREAISPKRILYVITTHYHNDHSGTNGQFRRDGVNVISATRGRDNILNGVQPGAKNMVPANITFDGEMRLYFAGKEVRLKHYPSAHTGTDVVVFFPQQKVICVGDLTLFIPPQMKLELPPGPIDYAGGGGIGPWIDVLQDIASTEGYDKVVPGHGVIGGKAEVLAYRDKLIGARTRIAAFLREGGKTEADLNAYLAKTEHWQELFIARAGHGLYWDLKP